MMPVLRQEWEKRFEAFGPGLRAVLPKGFPPEVNAYLHGVHCRLISLLLEGTPGAGHVLDLGCGYGRLMTQMNEMRPDLVVTGVDFSLVSCRAAAAGGLKVLCSNALELPFADGSFDSVSSVTLLMYLHQESAETLDEIARILKPRGLALFVDPSLEFESFARAALGRRTRVDATSGSGYDLKEYRRMLETRIGKVVAMGSTLGLSLMLPLLMASRRSGLLLGPLIAFTRLLDRLLGSFGAFGFHRWVLVIKGT